MLVTAAQIAKELKVEAYRVRYALEKLRESKQVTYSFIGQTYGYNKKALDKVRQMLAAN